jgi:hypothetical protein
MSSTFHAEDIPFGPAARVAYKAEKAAEKARAEARRSRQHARGRKRQHSRAPQPAADTHTR